MLLFVFTAASAPTNVSAIAISTTRIFLTWSQPSLLNGILHDYKIRLKLASDVTYGSSISAGIQLHYTINGLRPFTVYDIQVSLFLFTLFDGTYEPSLTLRFI